MSCKSCWQLAIIDKGCALSCKIRIKKLTLCFNFRYTFVVLIYCWYTRYFFTIQCFWKRPLFLKNWDFYQIIYGTYYRNISFSLIDFRVDWDLEYIERETENYDCFYDHICLCKFDFCSLSNFWFFYQTTEAPCHQRSSTYLE